MFRLPASLIVIWCFSATAAAATSDKTCTYDLAPIDPAASELDVSITCSSPELTQDLSFTYGPARTFVAMQETTPQSMRFRFRLAAFAAAETDSDRGLRAGNTILAAPDSILPFTPKMDRAYLKFRETNGAKFATGFVKDGDHYPIESERWGELGVFVTGQFLSATLSEERDLTLVLAQGGLDDRFSDLSAWIRDIAKSNSRFFRRPPLKGPMVVLIPRTGRQGISSGRVLSGSGAVMLMSIGVETTLASLYDEWVGVHEFLHLGTPLSRDNGLWFNEGIATYFEPILRYRAGWKTEDDIWKEWITDMPRGLNAMEVVGLQPGGRQGAYWGGALFMLISDIALRQRTLGKMGMEDCLVVILNRIGGTEARAPLHDMLDLCDEAAGASILHDIAERHVQQGTPINLPQLWTSLGVALNANGAILYDDTAPLAAIRKQIARGDPALFKTGIDKTMPVN